MLIEFSVGNYRSFKGVVHFSMVAAKITAKYKTLDENNVLDAGDVTLLASAAVYGANASGKSNLVAAMRFMRGFVINSSRESQVDEPIETEPFVLDAQTARQPSFFEAIFVIDGRRFRYGFEVSDARVVSEWLYHVPRVKELLLFERQGDTYTLSDSFKEGRDLQTRTRPNSLFLSVCAQFNGPLAQQVLRWFRQWSIISGVDDKQARARTEEMFEKDEYRGPIKTLVRKLDLGIEDIGIERTPLDASSADSAPADARPMVAVREFIPRYEVTAARRRVKTTHLQIGVNGEPSVSVEFDIDNQESEGTRKLFALAGPLVETLQRGRVLVVDELDARLHPLITGAIIQLFNSKETNRANAQLIFTTQDTNLLSNKVFRRDQVWFTEKDLQGATALYSLVEYKVRNDASFESDYIQGKYGAVPFVGDLTRLLDGSDA